VALASQPIPIASARRFTTRGDVGIWQHLLKPARYWHLFSLDAPSIAALWAWSFARAVHVVLSVDSLLLLFLGTWLLYVADRVLDGLRQNSARLRERHFFYMRHRTAALIAAVPASALLSWLVFARMVPAARRADILISAVAAGYFLLVHLGGAKIECWFPKELVVALVFATATAVPAMARLAPEGGPGIAMLLAIAAFFAALCWLNCIAIEKWEGSREFLPGPVRTRRTHDLKGQKSDRTTRWGQRHLRRICLAIASAALVSGAALLCAGQMAGARLSFAAAISAGLFFALDRSRLPAFPLRVAADAALLTPLLLLFVR
jgi:hypothetical protein